MSRDSLQGLLYRGPYPSYPCFLLIRGAHRVTNLLLRFVRPHTHVPMQFDCRWACGEHRRCPIWRPPRRRRKSKGCSCPYVHMSVSGSPYPACRLFDRAHCSLSCANSTIIDKHPLAAVRHKPIKMSVRSCQRERYVADLIFARRPVLVTAGCSALGCPKDSHLMPEARDLESHPFTSHNVRLMTIEQLREDRKSILAWQFGVTQHYLHKSLSRYGDFFSR